MTWVNTEEYGDEQWWTYGWVTEQKMVIFH